MKIRISSVSSVAFLGLILVLFTNTIHVDANDSIVRAYSGKLANGENIQLIYVASTKKLGLTVEDATGKLVSGYIFNEIAEPTGEFDLAMAHRKFGSAVFPEANLVVEKFKAKSVTIRFEKEHVLLESQVMDKPPFGECNFWCYEVFNWYMCYLCCLASSDC
jgi:hypothetical protein